MEGLFAGIPTEFDTQVRVSISPDTMVFAGAFLLIILASQRLKK